MLHERVVCIQTMPADRLTALGTMEQVRDFNRPVAIWTSRHDTIGLRHTVKLGLQNVRMCHVHIEYR